MARRKPQQKIEDIAEAAIACFTEAGYRRTQMSDVAKRLGIAAGTLYLYVSGKDALLHLAVLRLIDQLPEPDALPVSIDGFAATATLLIEKIGDGTRWPILRNAITSEAMPDENLLGAIGEELFDQLTPQRRIIWFLDACARDVPELEVVRTHEIRGRYIRDIAALLTRGADSERWPPARLFIVMRGAIELMAWCAVHRHRDSTRIPPQHESDIRKVAANAFASALMSVCKG